MKILNICYALLFACLLLAGCTKHSTAPFTGFYEKWTVSTIEAQAYFYPRGLVWDSSYAATPGDYVDFSQKGTIEFHVAGNIHTDLYDTTQYDLLKDTLVELHDSTSLPGSVSVKATGKSTISITESRFGIDTGEKLIYNLRK